MNDVPQPDCIPGIPHPNIAEDVIGHRAAQDTILNAANSGKLHHAWMLTGPQGIGKATLAYQAAAFLLDQPLPGDFDMFAEAPATSMKLTLDHPIRSRIQAKSEPGLFVLKRPFDEKTEKLRQNITVDEVRKLRNFFAMSAGGNGRRVVIVDCVDDMNPNAANALLKMLEEPPENAVLFLVVHSPAKVLPTIRSRCRILPCASLSDAALIDIFQRILPNTELPTGLTELAEGSVGAALQLMAQGGFDLYQQLVSLCGTLPRLDRAKIMKLIDQLTARGAEHRVDQFFALLDVFLSRAARAGVRAPTDIQAAPGERELYARMCPNLAAARGWADLQLTLGAAARKGRAVNLDPAALILDTLGKIEKAATSVMR